MYGSFEQNSSSLLELEQKDALQMCAKFLSLWPLTKVGIKESQFIGMMTDVRYYHRIKIEHEKVFEELVKFYKMFYCPKIEEILSKKICVSVKDATII